ncbi:MAG TPA: serine/threonine-protein kinase [Ktedonobacteraceae bacterium]|nr:serine/threonine-protein kinase [Ktedonobacteraceae bacterium]
MLQDDLIGVTLGNYTILAPLGQGGMARVYKAHQENLDREVAVKVLPPWFAADRNFVERFNQEARLVARLSHPNIVTVHDASEFSGNLYIVMQLVDGGTLKQRLDQLQALNKQMDVLEANRIFSQLASALSYAHDNGIIHRDVKPVNVLMDRAGRPILSDFGIAKVLAGSKELTRQGAGVGTPEYMSPEQCQGGPVDARADIYALGVMLFEALTGRLPFMGDNYPALAHSHIYEIPPHPGAINPAIGPAVAQVVITALMKNPMQRYQRANDMAEALERAVHSLPTAGKAKGGMGSGGLADPSRVTTMPLLYTCPQCRHYNKPSTRFCTACGFPLNQCGICGTQNPASNRFCTKCGQPLHSFQ